MTPFSADELTRCDPADGRIQRNAPPAPAARRSLEAIHIFAGLSEEVIAELAASCAEVRSAGGAIIVEEDVMGREMYLIGTGSVRIVSRRGTVHETLLAELGAGDFFGEMSLIECRQRSAAAVAAAPSVLYALAYRDIHRLFKWRPNEFSILILNISRDLCRRLRSMNDRFAGRTAAARRNVAFPGNIPTPRRQTRPARP